MSTALFMENMKKDPSRGIVYDDAGPTALDGMINTLEECGSSISDEFRKKAINIIEAAKR